MQRVELNPHEVEMIQRARAAKLEECLATGNIDQYLDSITGATEFLAALRTFKLTQSQCEATMFLFHRNGAYAARHAATKYLAGSGEEVDMHVAQLRMEDQDIANKKASGRSAAIIALVVAAVICGGAYLMTKPAEYTSAKLGGANHDRWSH